MRCLQIAVLTLGIAAVPLLAVAQPQYVPIEQRLSAEQLQQTGLDQLSPQQLQLLNRLLGQEQVLADERGEQSARSRLAGLLDRKEAEPVHATIKGDFRGWIAGNVIELDNGQRWRVTSGELYLGKAMRGAKATVMPGLLGAWYLQVEGQSPRAKVQRLP